MMLIEPSFHQRMPTGHKARQRTEARQHQPRARRRDKGEQGGCRERWQVGRVGPAGSEIEEDVTGGMSGARLTIVITAALLAFLVYANSLSADLVYDDGRAVVTNMDLRAETPWTNLFYNDFWGTPITDSGSHKSYRPVCVLTFRLNYLLSGLNPVGFHLTNVLLHCLTTGLFVLLALSVLRNYWAALVASCLFAVHPVHTEAVTGVVGRADVLSCLFFLACLLLYSRYCSIRDRVPTEASATRWVYLCGSLVSAALSMLSKEHGITVIGVCICYDYFIHSKKGLAKLSKWPYKTSIFQELGEGVPILLGWAAIGLTARLYLMGKNPPEFSSSDNPTAHANSALTRLLTFSYLPTVNFGLLAWPMKLSFDWSMEAIPLIESLFDYRNLVTVSFYSVFIALCSKIAMQLSFRGLSDDNCSKLEASRRENKESKGPFQLANGSPRTQELMSDSPCPKGGKPHSQRVSSQCKDGPSTDDIMTNPSVAQLYENLLLSVTIMVLSFIPASNLFFYVGFVVAERVLYIPSVGFCLLFGEAFLYVRTCVQRKRSLHVLLTVGVFSYLALMSARTVVRNQDWQTEEALYMSGASVNPAKAWGNLGNIYSGKGLKTEAERAYREALKYRGNMADVHYNLGVLYQEQSRHVDALKEYETAVECRPQLTVAHLNMGIIRARLGHHEQAEQNYQSCAEMDITGLKDPKMHNTAKISALYNWAKLKAAQSKHQEAISLFLLAVERKPAYYASHSLYNMLGESYFALGNDREAIAWYKRSLAEKPDHYPAYVTMGKALHRQGKNDAAEEYLKRAIEGDPHGVMGYQHYAIFLADIKRYSEAIATSNQALRLQPDNFDINFSAATVSRQAGNYEDALKYYKKAVEISPLDPTANMNLGAMYHTTKDYDLAEKSYLTTLQLKPGDELTRNNLQSLRRLKGSSDRPAGFS